MSVSLVRLLVVERVTEEVVRFAAVNSSLAALLDKLEDFELELEEDDFFDDSPRRPGGYERSPLPKSPPK